MKQSILPIMLCLLIAGCNSGGATNSTQNTARTDTANIGTVGIVGSTNEATIYKAAVNVKGENSNGNPIPMQNWLTPYAKYYYVGKVGATTTSGSDKYYKEELNLLNGRNSSCTNLDSYIIDFHWLGRARSKPEEYNEFLSAPAKAPDGSANTKPHIERFYGIDFAQTFNRKYQNNDLSKYKPVKVQLINLMSVPIYYSYNADISDAKFLQDTSEGASTRFLFSRNSLYALQLPEQNAGGKNSSFDVVLYALEPGSDPNSDKVKLAVIPIRIQVNMRDIPFNGEAISGQDVARKDGLGTCFGNRSGSKKAYEYGHILRTVSKFAYPEFTIGELTPSAASYGAETDYKMAIKDLLGRTKYTIEAWDYSPDLVDFKVDSDLTHQFAQVSFGLKDKNKTTKFAIRIIPSSGSSSADKEEFNKFNTLNIMFFK